MQENKINTESTPSPKLSKLAVFSLTMVILTFVLDFTIGFKYSNLIDKLIEIALGLLYIWFTYFIMIRIPKKGLRGYKIAKYAFIGTIILTLVDWVSAIPLSKESNSLNKFAKTVSPTFFDNDLKVLASYGDSNMTKIFSYKKEADVMRNDIKEVGKVEECSFDVLGTKSEITFGPRSTYEKFLYLTTGTYLIRCFGENKPIDITVDVTKKGDSWEISGFQYNTNILPKKDSSDQKE